MTLGNAHRYMKKQGIVIVLGCLLSTAATAGFIPGFSILQLEDLGFNTSQVRSINNLGLTAGSSIAGGAFEAEARPVFWDANGVATQLENSSNPSLTNQTIFVINDQGNMAGRERPYLAGDRPADPDASGHRCPQAIPAFVGGAT